MLKRKSVTSAINKKADGIRLLVTRFRDVAEQCGTHPRATEKLLNAPVDAASVAERSSPNTSAGRVDFLFVILDCIPSCSESI